MQCHCIVIVYIFDESYSGIVEIKIMSDYSPWDAHFSPPHLPHLDPQGRRGRENAKNFRTCPGNSKYWLIDLNFLNVNVERLKIEIWKNFLCPLHGDRSDKVSQIISKNSVSHHLCSICFDRKNKIDGETVMMTVCDWHKT